MKTVPNWANQGLSMENERLELESSEEVPGVNQPSSDSSPERSGLAKDDSDADQSEAKPPAPQGPKAGKFRLGPMLEINDGAALMHVAFRGTINAETLASVFGLELHVARNMLDRLDGAGLVTKTNMVVGGPVGSTAVYQIRPEGLQWLIDRDIGKSLAAD